MPRPTRCAPSPISRERYSFDEIRVSHHQNLVLPHVKRDDLFAVWKVLDAAGLAAANLGLAGDIIACPGLDYCALATARSIPIAQAISRSFADLDRQHEIGPLKINISGCINACGHHHVGHIGILGLDKKGEEYLPDHARRLVVRERLDRHHPRPGLCRRMMCRTPSRRSSTPILRIASPARSSSPPIAGSAPQPFKEALYAAA